MPPQTIADIAADPAAHPAADTPAARPLTMLLCALGGEGGGVLADWLVDTARRCGHAVQATSIPGVAQRTGATTYYVEIFPLPDAALGGRRPVFGLYAVPGAIDLLAGSELLELARQAAAGMADPGRTAVLASTRRALTVAEKMALGDGRVDDERLLAALRASAAELEAFDMGALADEAGTVISAVMLGAIGAWAHGRGRLPFPREAYEATIRAGGKGIEASLRGFGLAWQRVAQAHARREQVLQIAREVAARLAPPPLPAPLAAAFPADVHELLALGHARVVDYQDAAYGALYAERLQRVLQAERAAGAAAAQAPAEAPADHPATREAARWLALWMAYDDIVRVAELKSRASRFARVAREVKLEHGELLRIHDHFKPGVPEFAALLPARAAAALQRWDARRVAAGRPAFALPLKLGAHTVLGLLALRLLAAARRLRRRGSRYAAEQALIERWLGAVERGLRESAALGLEIARCGRLIKGYGATNERGKQHLLHLVDHLARGEKPAAARADAVAAAREAALADDAGRAFDQTLAAHGAPPRPLVAQPIRWHRRPAGGAG